MMVGTYRIVIGAHTADAATVVGATGLTLAIGPTGLAYPIAVASRTGGTNGTAYAVAAIVATFFAFAVGDTGWCFTLSAFTTY